MFAEKPPVAELELNLAHNVNVQSIENTLLSKECASTSCVGKKYTFVGRTKKNTFQPSGNKPFSLVLKGLESHLQERPDFLRTWSWGSGL